MRAPVRFAAPALLLAASLLAGCSAAPAPEPPAPDDAPSEPSAPPAGEAAGVACLLLDSAALEAIVADGSAWVVAADEGTSCHWVSETGVRLEIELRPIDAFDSAAGLADLGGAKALSDADGYVEVWQPAGGPRIGEDFAEATVIARLDSGDALLGDALPRIAYEAALAHENLPASAFTGEGGTAAGEAPGIDYIGDVVEARFSGTVPSTGNSFGIELTEQDVEEAALPAAVIMYCGPGDGLLTSGIYRLQIADIRVTDGVTNVSMEATERVDGPGRYPGALTIHEADGDRFELAGELAIDEGMLSGSFEMYSGSTLVEGEWECLLR